MSVLVVTATLNAAHHIAGAFDSLAAQSRTDWRHVVVDGGSEDDTCGIVTRRAAVDSRVSLLRRPGAGLYKALFAGFDTRALGETVLTWLNADDRLTPWALESACEAMKGPTAARWVTGLPAVWDRRNVLRAVLPAGWTDRRLIAAGWRHDDAFGCLQQEGSFFSADLLQSLSADERAAVEALKLAGDFLLWRSFARRTRLHVLPSVLGGFRVTGENRSIAEAALYREEVMANDGAFAPGWVMRPLRRLHDLCSAAAALRRAHQAMAELHGQVRRGDD